ncbi:MAG: type II secretion system GspH family protein [Terrimicrobiaceae bacterium]|nr:type II secretion system GspH family protein [Terrimicrobiaceae bacterium]
MRPPFRPLGHLCAFSLLELAVVVAIISMLAVIAAPEYGRLLDRARSTACMGNLRAIGAALGAYLSDNDGRLPYINNPPPYQVYEDDDDLPPEQEAVTLLEAFGPYGIAETTLRCPADVKASNFFGRVGTSYEWVPRIDGEQSVSPKVLSRRGGLVTRRLGRITVLRDFDTVHFGRGNRLLGDGRVIYYTK